MRRNLIVMAAALLLTSCSPRDILSRRLATDLIAVADQFKSPEHFVLQTGIISNKDYASSEYLILQHHGWISASTAACSPGLTPPPCWDILLTAAGVDTVRSVVPADEADKSLLAIPVARREFLGVTGISRQGNLADVEFAWKWTPLNEIGAVLYSSDMRYKSTVGFRQYDDGWRLVATASRTGQTLEDALKNAEPLP